jgi:hypothetical protein
VSVNDGFAIGDVSAAPRNGNPLSARSRGRQAVARKSPMRKALEAPSVRLTRTIEENGGGMILNER